VKALNRWARDRGVPTALHTVETGPGFVVAIMSQADTKCFWLLLRAMVSRTITLAGQGHQPGEARIPESLTAKIPIPECANTRNPIERSPNNRVPDTDSSLKKRARAREEQR
jgi:hypothetical protein